MGNADGLARHFELAGQQGEQRGVGFVVYRCGAQPYHKSPAMDGLDSRPLAARLHAQTQHQALCPLFAPIAVLGAQSSESPKNGQRA